jgi:hypothetical protein
MDDLLSGLRLILHDGRKSFRLVQLFREGEVVGET